MLLRLIYFKYKIDLCIILQHQGCRTRLSLCYFMLHHRNNNNSKNLFKWVEWGVKLLCSLVIQQRLFLCLSVSFGLRADISLYQLLLMFGRWIPEIFWAVSNTHSGAFLSWAMHHGSFPWGCFLLHCYKSWLQVFFIPGQWWATLLIDQHSDPTV